MTTPASTPPRSTSIPVDRNTSPQDAAQTSPAPFYPQHDYRYEVQMLFDLQKSMGEVTTAIKVLTQSQDEMRRKIDDLVRWKAMIIGGAVVLGALSGIAGFVAARGWDYVSFGKAAAQEVVVSEFSPGTGESP